MELHHTAHGEIASSVSTMSLWNLLPGRSLRAVNAVFGLRPVLRPMQLFGWCGVGQLEQIAIGWNHLIA
jgi:hypothetical protein